MCVRTRSLDCQLADDSELLTTCTSLAQGTKLQNATA